MSVEIKPSNPKDAIGTTKLPLHLVPTTGIEEEALAFLEGALKYGKFNFRAVGARISIYLDAMKRHIHKFENGEDRDLATLVHHLGNVRACCNIILDGQLLGNIVDDRAPRSPNSQRIDEMSAHVKHLQNVFAAHNPHQHTIQDELNGNSQTSS